MSKDASGRRWEEGGGAYFCWEDLVVALLVEVGGLVGGDGDGVHPLHPARSKESWYDHTQGIPVVRRERLIVHLIE